MIDKNARTLCQAQGAERAEELIGVLTAISVVAKRMAVKLAQLESQIAETEEENTGEQHTKPPRNANQSYTVQSSA